MNQIGNSNPFCFRILSRKVRVKCTSKPSRLISSSSGQHGKIRFPTATSVLCRSDNILAKTPNHFQTGRTMTTMTMSGRKPLVSFLRLSLLVWFGINIIISSCISAAAASSASGSTRAASHLRSAAAVADKAQPNQAAAAAATTPGGRNLVIGGSDATQNRYPSYVALVNDQYTVGCGGTLIAPDVVLTAAHCSR